MKIAITSQGDSLESPVDSRFGRTPGFIITDESGEEVSYVDNEQNMNAASGAGIQAGQKIVDKGVDVLITGNCGPKAFSVLTAGDVEVYVNASGTVKEALEAFNNDELDKADDSNVQGHWM